MRSAAADRLTVLLLVGLVVGSVWLKSLTQPAAAPTPAGGLEQALAARLAAQGFAVKERRLPLGSILVEGRRGACAVQARNAGDALGAEVAFAQTARDIGPVAYLYGGQSYPAPPVFALRVDRLRREAMRLVGMRGPVAMPIALAKSPACGGGLFGLADIALPA